MAREGEALTSKDLVAAAREQLAREAGSSGAMVEAARRQPGEGQANAGPDLSSVPVVGEGKGPVVEAPVGDASGYRQDVDLSRTSGRQGPPPLQTPQPMPAPPSERDRTTARGVRRLIALVIVGFVVFSVVNSNFDGIREFVEEQLERPTTTAGPREEAADAPPDEAQGAADPGGLEVLEGGVELSPAVPVDDSWRRHCAVNPLPTHVVSAWRANDVVLDGGQTDGLEWSEAAAVFMPLQPGVGDPARFQPCSTWMTAWFMNDDEWLYGLYYVAWEGDIDPDDSGGIALFRGSRCCGVDSDFGTLANSPLGEFKRPWDGYGWNETRWFGDEEASPAGTVDMEGAGSHDGTGYWFEWRKRLNSGDGTDWILEPGQTVGDVSTLTWFLTNLWDNSQRRSYEHPVTMTLATG